MTSSVRVLVVEDDPSVRGLLQHLLESEGYLVSTAPDGVAGLAAAGALLPAVVVLDLMMPELSGLQVLEELRADEELADVPVVVVTGQADMAPRVADLLGPDNVFLKPFSVAELMDRVNAVVRGG